MLKPGQILNGTYKVLCRIGAGGNGVVFQAYHLRIKKNVAIKLIKDNFKSDIRSEVDVLKNLKNDYLPQIIDFVEDGNDIYTVMEYVEGHDFRWYISKGRSFSEKKVIKYASQLCDAVSYLHSQTPPIIHSDIKPSNLMLTDSDNICLIDFNISAIANNGYAMSKGGTADFSAPEQFLYVSDEHFFKKNSISEIDEETELIDAHNLREFDKKIEKKKSNCIDIRTDIYGIGTTLFYILTGRIPQSGRLDFRGISVSSQFMNCIKKAANINYEERYKSIDELKADLLKIDQKKPVYKVMISVISILAVALMGIPALNLINEGSDETVDSDKDVTTSESSAITEISETTIILTTSKGEPYSDLFSEDEIVTENAIVTENTTLGIETASETVQTTKATILVSNNKNNQNKDYINIKGKRFSTKLSELDLQNMQLTSSDIIELKYMKKLEILWLNDNNITNLQPISELTSLSELHLGNNNISDISFLAKLKNLTLLSIKNNCINDISALEGLTSLKTLSFSDNNISDISVLKNLTSLERLWINNNNISDISSLKDCTQMIQLNLVNNKINDIRCLSEMTNLLYLYISDNPINDISALEEMSLSILDISNTFVENISYLADMNKLNKLGLYNLPVPFTDIETLQHELPECDFYTDEDYQSKIGIDQYI